ncbi:MAG: PDZ domain-containing protein, partial [Pirellulaceae bacterium]|nr:PDZ domain-containing protein [Pirellulaceae bacterium]
MASSNDRIVIKEIAEGSPAKNSGMLRIGDEVCAMIDIDAERMPLKTFSPDKAEQFIRGLVGQSVKLMIRSPNDKEEGSSAETVGGFRDPQSILAVKYKENTGLSDCKNQ